LGGGSSSSSSSGSGSNENDATYPRRLIYLSCGWRAFERDAAALGSGRWRLASAEAFLFFPGTDALETLAVFDRAS
jgi:tRNA/tmRNA/rRNA uracil-C5-methylase (TrmA/RlmC/RlmD family)